MKFKFIYIIFNILIILFLLVIGVFPLVLFGPEFAVKFWTSAWPLGLVLLAVLAILNIFFLSNHRLFMLLEREDWPALVDFLERRIFDRERYSPRMVKLLANSYIIMSDSGGVLRLEKKLALAKPALIEANALTFGSARILGGDAAGAVDFFHKRMEKAGDKCNLWIRLFYAFSLLLSRNFSRAEQEFCFLAACNDALIAGLSAWFIYDTLSKHAADQEQSRVFATDAKKNVKGAIKSISAWKKESTRIETEVFGAVIKKYVDEAGIWLFGG